MGGLRPLGWWIIHVCLCKVLRGPCADNHGQEPKLTTGPRVPLPSHRPPTMTTPQTRRLPNILVTGTPGTGKTCTATRVAVSGWFSTFG
jgi:Cdc6-like AAA superfamily ATPase